MSEISDLFVALAEISGVFVGFGALIGVGRRGDIDPIELAAVRAVVISGLLVIVAALVPVLAERYGVGEPALWRLCSLVFIVLIWLVLLLALRSLPAREAFLASLKDNPVAATFYWLVLEVSIQLPLVFNLIGFKPGLAHAFYTTALVVNLVQAAFLLAMIVFTDRDTA